MLQLTNLEKNKIKDFVKNTLKNTNLEFEARVIPNSFSISQMDFINVIKKIKNLGFKNVSVNEMILDINIKEENSIRLTIHGDSKIKSYCHDNSIKNIKDSLEFIEKKRFSLGNVETRPLDLRNYNMRINLKEETNLNPKNKNVMQIAGNLSHLDKTYRYKKRFSFISPDKLFKYDLTIVKSSSKKYITYEKKTLTKGEVMDKMKKYVIKPKNVKLSFSEWWDTLDNSQVVKIREQTIQRNLYFKNLKDSETLTNPMEYEIELEFIGNKDKSLFGDQKQEDIHKIINTSLLENLKLILQSLQQSEFVISNQEKKNLRDDYYKLTNFTRFTDSLPMAITLERENIVELSPDNYENQINIRKNYSVTEKTDGERNLLFIDAKGEVFLINRQNTIKKMGLKVTNYTNTILDGELVSQNLSGKSIRLFLAFDLYFSQGKDFRERILMRSTKDKSDNEYQKSRLEELEDLMENLQVESEKCEIEFVLTKKVFKFGNVQDNNQNFSKLVEEREEYILNNSHDLTELSIQKLRQDINLAKQDTKIFEESQKILIQIESQQYNYQTDGLIFTPIYKTVGEGENKRNRYGGRWGSLLKWKPAEDNSIDFKVRILRDNQGRDIEKYITIANDLCSYKKIKLFVGYDKDNHQNLNGLRVLNEDPQYLDGYNIIPFEPIHPFANKIYETNIKVGSNGLVCQNGDVITDNSIIEFSFDKNELNGFNWVPLRRRDNLVPNAFSTASNVWNTIFNPITTSMISTGQNIPYNYYGSDKKKGLMTPVYKFHNLVKKVLLQSHCQEGSRLLDIGCGEMGDLHKYLSLKLDLLVGIENNKHNLINERKGAVSRVLDQKGKDRDEEKNLLSRTFLIWGDASKNISSSKAGLDSLNRFYLDVLWGNVINRKHIERLGNPRLKEFRGVCQDKFDVISCQFALHYFFKNTTSIHELMTNVSENLKIGGKFLATFFDGRKIFKLLEDTSKIEEKDDSGKLLWRIDKKYKIDTLYNDEKCLSLPIQVYIETFSQSVEEYLINIDYLREIMELYGMEITSVKSFEEYCKDIRFQDLNDMQKDFSFLNCGIVVTKKKDIVEMKGGGKKNILDIFISNKDKLGGGVEEEQDMLDDDSEYSDNNSDMDDNSDMEDDQEEEEEDEANTNSLSEDEDDRGDNGSELGEVIEEPLAESEPIDDFMEGGGKVEAEELDIVTLDNIYSSPDLTTEDVNLLSRGHINTDLETTDTESNNNGLVVEELNSTDILDNTFEPNLENVNLEISDLNSSIAELKTENPIINPVLEEGLSKQVDKDVKVIKLEGDKNALSLIKK